MELTVLESRKITDRTGIVYKIKKQFASEINFWVNICAHKFFSSEYQIKLSHWTISQ